MACPACIQHGHQHARAARIVVRVEDYRPLTVRLAVAVMMVMILVITVMMVMMAMVHVVMIAIHVYVHERTRECAGRHRERHADARTERKSHDQRPDEGEETPTSAFQPAQHAFSDWLQIRAL